MNEIQRGNLGEIPRRVLQVNAAGNPVPVLSPIMLAAMVLENDRIEYKYASSQRICGVAVGTVAAAPAVFSGYELYNPPGSQVVAVVTSLVCDCAAGGGARVRLRPASYAPVTVLTTAVRDSRWGTTTGGPGKAQCRAASGTIPALPPEPALGWLPQGAVTRLSDGWIIQPGWAISVIIGVANVALNAGSIDWYERPVTADELA